LNVIGDLMRAIDTFYYNIILSLAEVHWSLLRGLILMGHTIETINRWLIEDAFAPLIAQTNASLSVAVSFAFLIALIILGLTYMLAALVRLDVVNFRSAITWYIAGALFFALGPSLYQGMNDFRTNIAQGFYLSTLQGLQNNVGATFSSLDQVQSTDLALGPLCDYLGVYLPGATSAGAIDGLDVALAYLRADGPDVMGFPYPLYSPGCPVHLLHPFTGNYISGVPQEWFPMRFQLSPVFHLRLLSLCHKIFPVDDCSSRIVVVKGLLSALRWNSPNYLWSMMGWMYGWYL
jgi:hypothetical protein